MKAKLFCCIILTSFIASCGGGYHRVRYSEMVTSPVVTLVSNELIVTTRNSGGDGLSVYKIDINIHDKKKTVELRGYQAIGRPQKTEFKISLTETQLLWIERYQIYWIDPGNKKTRVKVENKL